VSEGLAPDSHDVEGQINPPIGGWHKNHSSDNPASGSDHTDGSDKVM